MGAGYWALGAGQKQDPEPNASFIFFYSLQPLFELLALVRNKPLTRTRLSGKSTFRALSDRRL
jgi:hypothetical protein